MLFFPLYVVCCLETGQQTRVPLSLSARAVADSFNQTEEAQPEEIEVMFDACESAGAFGAVDYYLAPGFGINLDSTISPQLIERIRQEYSMSR